MNRSGGFPYFLWQERNGQHWKTLSFVEVCALNKSAAKDQKKITLPYLDPTNKTAIYFEKMISKNTITDEKQVRCLILNNKSMYAIWTSNKSGEGSFASYSPRMTYFLEVMFQKEVSKVDFYYKTEYEVDFLKRTIKDRQTGILCNIQREEIDFIPPLWNKRNMKQHVRNIFESEHLMEAVLTYSVDRIKNLLFGIPMSGTEVSSCFSLPLPTKDLICTLKKEDKTQKETLMTVDPYLIVYENYEECNVVSEKNCFLSATLILTNLEENTNKFCILQLLKVKNKKKFFIWSRHGRVGYKGNGEISEPFSNLKEARKEFEDSFYDKTGNRWCERDSFKKIPKRYEYIHTYFNPGDPEDIFNTSLENIQSTMDKAMQDLLLPIFYGTNFGLVIKKWLLQSVAAKVGILTVKQLLEAFTALNEIANLLTLKNKGKKLLEACNNYYMKMPHNTNYDAPKMIMSTETIEEEAYVLQTLAYISVNAARRSMENPVDLYFRRFKWSITHLDQESQEFIVLRESLLELQGPTHTSEVDLLAAFKWHNPIETERFIDKGNNLLLWHGTQLSNFIGIVKDGLKLPPKEAPTTSSMFGKALYFADVSSKSAQYCFASKKNNTGLLLLCEVSMGTPLNVIHGGDYSSHPEMFGGLIAQGEYYPSEFIETILAPDALLPKAPLKRTDNKDITLKYNEYIVYDERQVKILYLLKVKFKF